jgi:hypothetical protein
MQVNEVVVTSGKTSLVILLTLRKTSGKRQVCLKYTGRYSH